MPHGLGNHGTGAGTGKEAARCDLERRYHTAGAKGDGRMENLYTIPEVAYILGKSVPTIYRWIGMGLIGDSTPPGVGRGMRVSESDLERWRASWEPVTPSPSSR